MSKLFTGAGDSGETGVLGEGRLSKADLRFEVIGTIDEAGAVIGWARSLSSAPGCSDTLLGIQRNLYRLMAEAASTEKTHSQFAFASQERVAELEAMIEHYGHLVQLPNEFVVSGDSQAQAALDLARTVVRRAERRMAQYLEQGEADNQMMLVYLNRLSSLLFILSLYELQRAPTLAKHP